MLRKSLVHTAYPGLRPGRTSGRAGMARAAILGLLLILGLAGIASAKSDPTDIAVQTALQQELSKKLPAVHVAVEDRVATLTGAVDRYTDKIKAGKTARKYGALNRIVNSIEVAGAAVPDSELEQKLASKLAGDQTYQTNVFNAFALDVHNGVVTLSGYAQSYSSHNSALALVAAEKGVKGVVDKVEVLPLSSYDDRIRVRLARAIYGMPGMQKYALDPVHPIRIIVSNGNVVLEGAVISKVDRTMAQMAANQVPGVFSVKNNLQVN